MASDDKTPPMFVNPKNPGVASSVKIVKADYFESNGNLKGADGKKCHIVLFYSNGCGHCHNLAPTFAEFADIAQFIKVVALDCADEANNKLVQNIKDSKCGTIDGYPTIWFYKDGKPDKVYEGDRSLGDFLDKAIKFCSCSCKCQ